MKTAKWGSRPIIDCSYSANFCEINENVFFKKEFSDTNDRRKPSVPHFSSNNGTLLIYSIFRLVFALISLENDALFFFFFFFFFFFSFL